MIDRRRAAHAVDRPRDRSWAFSLPSRRTGAGGRPARPSTTEPTPSSGA